MRELIVYMLETMACGAALMLLYGVLFDRRVPFAFCRAYLLLAVVASAAIPLLRIPVWNPAGPTEITGGVFVGAMAIETAPAVADAASMRNVVLAVYAVGVVLSLAAVAMQLRNIRRLARGGEVLRESDPRMVLTAERVSSFSFFGTIYVSRDAAQEDMTAIVAHESSHIRHGHSAEKVAMQLLRALMWWNPFVWIAQRRLSEVHEYEADNDVLNSGYDVNDYITAILKSLLGYSPDIANSFRDSLTKKRFKMMTKSKMGRYALLRTLAVVPVAAALLCTFSFTAKAVEPENIGSDIESIYSDPVDRELSVARNVTPQEDDKAYLRAETMPRFQDGGMEGFREWVMSQIRYPEETLKSGKNGRVIVKFIVEKDGSVSNVTLLESFDKAAGDESLRVVKSSPKWSPGMQDGKAVRVQYVIPVQFAVVKGDAEK